MKKKIKIENLRTHCETEDEEEVILGEIEKMFPTDVDNDFGEFIQSNSLEKIIKKANPKTSIKSLDVLSMEDMALLCRSFIDIMTRFSRFVRIIFNSERYLWFPFQMLLLQSQVEWKQYKDNLGFYHSLQNQFICFQSIAKEIQILSRY